MALQGCYALLKYFVVIVNLIFWLAGCAVLSVSIWLLTGSELYLSMAQNPNSYYTGVYILLGAGALMAIVGFLGCWGAYRESQCMLITFFMFLFVILVAEIAGIVWTASHTKELEDSVRETVRNTVRQEYGTEAGRTKLFDSVQRGLKCCGVNGPSDWAESSFNGKKDTDSLIDLGISAPAITFKIPVSCCKLEESSIACQALSKMFIASQITNISYNEGCADKLIEVLRENSNIVIIVGIAIGVVEFLGLIFSLVLCCAVRAMDRYKA